MSSKQQDKVVTLLEKLREKLDMLERKEKLLTEKFAAEVERGRKLGRAKNKFALIRCIKSKRCYEQQIEQVGNLQLHLYDQMIMLEAAEASPEMVDPLINGAIAMKDIHKAINIDDVHNTLDEINEEIETPMFCLCRGADRCDEDEFDLDELLEKLENL